jgi:acyl carrier protein
MGLDIVELVMEVEHVFGIEIPDADAERLRTVGSMYAYLRERVAPEAWPPPPAGTPMTADPLWTDLLDVIEKETGVDRAQLVPSASFIEDLDLD